MSYDRPRRRTIGALKPHRFLLPSGTGFAYNGLKICVYGGKLFIQSGAFKTDAFRGKAEIYISA